MQIIDAPSLAALTTLRLGGRAIALVRPEERKDLDDLARTLEKLGGMPFMLGRGSNLLAKDGALPLVLVRPPLWQPPAIIGKTDDERILVRADSATPLPRLLAWSAKRGLAGLENLTGIPGEVGGALRMNAGSYGSSFCDVVAAAELFSKTTGVRLIARDAMQPGYRHTVLPGDEEPQLILSVTLALKPERPEMIRLIMRERMRRKEATQPIRAWSAGCAFANPEGDSAGRLLDSLGYRGKQFGGMAFSEKHANFLINTGSGTAAQAFELLDEAREAVRQAYQINLRFEVKVLPC